MYECIGILTEFRTGGGAFLAIQCFCKKTKGKKTNNNSYKTIIIIRILLIITV